MSAIGYASGPLILDSLDMQRVLELLLQRYSLTQVWAPLGTLPRLATSRVRLTTYHSWVLRVEWLDRPALHAYLFCACHIVRSVSLCASSWVVTHWRSRPAVGMACLACRGCVTGAHKVL